MLLTGVASAHRDQAMGAFTHDGSVVLAAMARELTAVIGGGIVGLAIARELTLRRPGSDVVVLEKESAVGTHQTGHNSGVVHAGLYYAPGSLKAALCTRGRSLLREYCASRGLAYETLGKLVVAVSSSELDRLAALERSASSNLVPGLTRVDAAGIAAIEPGVRGIAALHSPQTAITDFRAIAESLASDVVAAGGSVRLGCEVVALVRTAGGQRIVLASGESVLARQVIVCGGLQSDRLAGPGSDDLRIVPFRGEYLSVLPAKQDVVRGLVYPVPDPRYPFLGVHFTRTVTGGLEIGPNAVLALAREGYRRGSVSLADVRDLATWPGTWRLARRHWRTGARELRGSLSVRAYLRLAQAYVPSIGLADVERGRVGVRAQAVERDGALVDDFRITRSDGVTCLRNAPSPAATSSLAIAEHVVAVLPGG
jgi:L-2-hydroxyglutarate oxidase